LSFRRSPSDPIGIAIYAEKQFWENCEYFVHGREGDIVHLAQFEKYLDELIHAGTIPEHGVANVAAIAASFNLIPSERVSLYVEPIQQLKRRNGSSPCYCRFF
jgi:hypothetical protein